MHPLSSRTVPELATPADLPRLVATLALRALVALLAACDEGNASRGAEAGPALAASRGELPVTVRAGAVSAPDTVAAGWTRLRVAEDGAGHIVVLFRLAEDAADAGLPAFAAALDGAATPAGAIALGGPEVGDSGEVIVELMPGRYAVACVARGKDGHRHAAGGEAVLLVVRDDRRASDSSMAAERAAPDATQEVRMADFAYVGLDRWAAGPHVLAVRNVGAQDHQLRLARLRPGATLGAWMTADDPRQVATDVAGVARLGAGQTAYLPVDLPEGEYVAYCLVPDPRSRRPHVMLGMMRAIHVEAHSARSR